MTGNANSLARAGSRWFPSFTKGFRSYVAVDGGSGAHLLAALAVSDPSFRQADSPRHANVLLLIEPITEKLLPAVREYADALARPFQVFILGEADGGDEGQTGARPRVEQLFPGAHRITHVSPETVLSEVMQHDHVAAFQAPEQAQREAMTIQVPQRQELELATELAVLSLGPIQPFTAGPLRLFLICDGEQVFSAQVDAGYAHRGIEQRMSQADWSHGLALARRLDPLAPLAGQLAYVRALEQLQQWQMPSAGENVRDAALALERVSNVLWWSVHFAHILDDAPLTHRLHQLARTFTEQVSMLWQHPPTAWLLPHYQITFSSVSGHSAALSQLRQVGEALEAVRRSLERNRFLALRIRDIGVLDSERLTTGGVSGPVLEASLHGTGDVHSRLVTRLHAALLDVQEAVEILSHPESVPPHAAQWDVPVGEAQVSVHGSRGTIELHLVSQGGARPTQVMWHRPSAALLPLLPEILKGQKLADAEVIVASLDLAMAEADG